MSDARFEDGGERPLRLAGESAQDVAVMSALLQDAVLEGKDIAWMPRRRRLGLLMNRFRWEDQRDRPERVRALLTVDGALRVASSGIDPSDRDLVLSLLSMTFEADEDGGGRLHLVFAGDGEIAVDVECIDLRLADVTRPYAAPSGKAPRHPE